MAQRRKDLFCFRVSEVHGHLGALILGKADTTWWQSKAAHILVGKERERERWRQDLPFKSMPPVTQLLQSGLTFHRFHCDSVHGLTH
jgi:hypothetical protein